MRNILFIIGCILFLVVLTYKPRINEYFKKRIDTSNVSITSVGSPGWDTNVSTF